MVQVTFLVFTKKTKSKTNQHRSQYFYHNVKNQWFNWQYISRFYQSYESQEIKPYKKFKLKLVVAFQIINMEPINFYLGLKIMKDQAAKIT